MTIRFNRSILRVTKEKTTTERGQTMKMTLKAARVNRGFTQKEAAVLLDISEATISNYERGISSPDVGVLKRIEALYEVQYNDIVFLSLKSNLIV